MISQSSRARAMNNKAYRHGMVNAQIEIDLPFQIRALRKQRGWTQPELAAKAGMKQSRISNIEKPGATRFTLETLRRLAEAFDVALVVRFAPFGELVAWSERFSPDEFAVLSFGDESRANNRRHGRAASTAPLSDRVITGRWTSNAHPSLCWRNTNATSAVQLTAA